MPTTRTASPTRRSRATAALGPVAGLNLRALDFANPAAWRSQLAQLKPKQAPSLFGEALKLSTANAEVLAHALITPRTARPSADELKACEQNGLELVQWAATAKRTERVVLVRAFAQASQKRELISGIGRLLRPQARAFMKDYVETDGDLGAVADWLDEAGAILRVAQGEGVPVDGFLDDAWNAVKKGAKAAAGAVSSAVSAVIDGIETAGKSLVDILGAAARWTADRVGNLVRSLIEAGKKVADILAAAGRYGIEMVRGAVTGILAAGKALADIVSWAAASAFTIAAAAIDAALDFGRTVAQVMAEACKLVAAKLKVVVRAIIASGRKAAAILATVAGRTLSIVRTVLEGLFAAAVNLAEIVAGVCRNVAEQFRKGFIEGLIALGKGVAEIFKAALASGLGIAALAFAAILEALGGHRGLLPTELAEARKVFGWSIDLDRVKVANASYAADFIQAVNGGRPFTTMYVLNFSSKSDFKPNGELKSFGTLIHELTHVWQAVQAGPIYMIEALEQQLRKGSAAYRYTDAELAAHGGDLLKFGREAQAQIIEDYYVSRYLNGNPRSAWEKYLPYAGKVYRSRPISVGGLIRLPLVKPQLVRG